MKTDARVELRSLSVAAIAVLVFGIFAVITTPFNLAIAQIEAEPTLVGQEEIRARILEAERNPPDVEALGKELEGATKQDTSTTGGGGGLGDKLAAGCGWLSLRPTCIVYWILDTITDFFVTFLVSLASSIFDQFINISLYDLSAMPFVKLGFRITLGIANMFFVLILLWIAIATIFNFEPYTARSLLLKLIVAALLINFSLAIGSAFIQMSNGIAMIFYKELQRPFETKITGKLIQFPGTSIAQRVMLMSNFAAIKDTTPKGRATVAELDRVIREGKCEEIKEVRLYGDLGELVTTGASCNSAQAEAAWRQRFATPENSSDTIATALSAIFWKLAITPILIFVLLAGSIFLLIRQLSLAFILVLGPLAFLFMILPATQRFYGDWWEKLFKWSFFFPAFMFFLFISLQVGGGLLPEDLKSSDQRLGITFQYLMTIALLLGSLMAANQMGIMGAKTVTGWGNKLAGAAGKWTKGVGKVFAGRAAGAALGTRAGQWLASRRYLRHLGRPLEAVTAAGQRVREEREKAALKRRGLAAKISPQYRWSLMQGMAESEKADFIRESKPHQLKEVLGLTTLSSKNRIDLYQTMKKYDLEDKVLDAAPDLTAAVEMATQTEHTDPRFQEAFTSWLKSAPKSEIQKRITAKDIQTNELLQRALRSRSAAFRDITDIANTREKAIALGEWFIDLANVREQVERRIQAGMTRAEAMRETDVVGAAAESFENPRIKEELQTSPITLKIEHGIALGKRIPRREEEVIPEEAPPATPPTP